MSSELYFETNFLYSLVRRWGERNPFQSPFGEDVLTKEGTSQTRIPRNNDTVETVDKTVMLVLSEDRGLGESLSSSQIMCLFYISKWIKTSFVSGFFVNHWNVKVYWNFG